jgi:phage-related protein
MLIIFAHDEIRASGASAAVGRLQQARLPPVSATSAGQFRLRAVPRSDRSASAIGQAAKRARKRHGGTVDDFDGDTYRAVYTVHFRDAVYVLHAFKKKAKRGIKTPQSDIDLVKRRLRDAEQDHAQRFRKESK